MKKKKNIYMGEDSIAKLPVFGKVDTDNEICLNAIATAYDALNNKMLTRQLGVYDTTTLTEINGRFSILKMLCRNYAPNKLTVVDNIHRVVVDNFKGLISDDKAILALQNICVRHDLNPGILNIAAKHITQAENLQFMPNIPNFFGMNLFVGLQPKDRISKERKRMRG